MTETGSYQNNWERANEKTINGIPLVAMHTMLEKNSDRYIEIFERNENKKVFVSLNFAAMFFSIYWFFYRKMYLYGIIFLIAATIFSVATSFAVGVVFAPELVSISQEYDKLEEALESGKISNESSKIAPSEYQQKLKELNLESEAIQIKIAVVSLIINLVIRLVPGLFADCIYRKYLFTDGLKPGGGGVSKNAVLIVIAVELVLGILI